MVVHEYPNLSRWWKVYTGLEGMDTSSASLSQAIRVLIIMPILFPFMFFDVAKHWRD